MDVLILADGDPPSVPLAQYLTGTADLVVATDGAAHRMGELGIEPDMVCGDFDSVGMGIKDLQAGFPLSQIVETPSQSLADLEKAVLLAQSRRATRIVLAGATGGRVDHTLSSFALLVRYVSEIPLFLVADSTKKQDERHDPLRFKMASIIKSLSPSSTSLESEDIPVQVTSAVLAGQECRIGTTPGSVVSLVTFSGARVSIEGVEWPLASFALLPGTQGVSNIATGAEVVARVEEGAVFLIAQRKLEGCLADWTWR